MDGLSVIWTRTAIRQRDYIFEYWNNRNQSNAYSQKLNMAIGERIELLKSQPDLGKATNFGDTRVVYFWHYCLLYKIVEYQLIITGFWDNRQDPQKFLAFLKS